MTQKTITIRRWKHKETGKEYKVLPWWECDGNIVEAKEAKEILHDAEDDWSDRLYAVGCLAQVGWLIENEDGVWFGVGPKAKDQFEDI
jgi:hypothetical protein